MPSRLSKYSNEMPTTCSGTPDRRKTFKRCCLDNKNCSNTLRYQLACQKTEGMPMTISRKEFLTGVGAVTLTGAMSGTVTWADDYPNQDIHLICGFPPGSGADVLVRYYGEKLRPVSGRNIIVENRTGANSNIATEYVARRAHRTRLRPCSRRRSSN